MPGTISFFRQSFPGKPTFTGEDIPDLKGKIIIVTGSNTGLGFEIARLLYSKNATVYMLARSKEKTMKAIQDLKTAFPNSSGALIYLHLDLADLDTIKATAAEFHRREAHLHILFNNAGVGYPTPGSKTQQGYELQLGVNCIGTFLLTRLLTPILVSTAAIAPPASVRVVWVSSSAAEAVHPKNFVENLADIEKMGGYEQYCISKLGGYLLAVDFAARLKKAGVVSVPLNPGNLDSEFWRTQSKWVTWVLRRTLLWPPVFGAWTCLFAGFSGDVGMERSGRFVAPWGRFWKVSKGMLDASKSEVEGGTGIARRFWDWSENQTEEYL